MDVPILGSTVEIDGSVIDESDSVVREQVWEYERGDRRSFDLTVATPEGPTGEAMTAMAAIPFGETRTYGEIADELGTAPVVVGRACAGNPVPVVVPCHRVVGSDGSLRGYSAAGGVVTKRRLLDHEAPSEPAQARLPTWGESERDDDDPSPGVG